MARGVDALERAPSPRVMTNPRSPHTASRSAAASSRRRRRARACAPSRARRARRARARRRGRARARAPAPIRRRRCVARGGDDAARADVVALDAFARASPSARRALELLRASRGGRGVDPEAMMAMCYVGAIRRRRCARGEIADVAKICERWRVRVGERLERARTSLEAEDGSAAARAVAREVEKCEAEATALARRLAHEAIEATEAFESEATRRRDEGGRRRGRRGGMEYRRSGAWRAGT